MSIVAPEYPRHRFSVTDYHRMAEAGILAREDRVELIDGEVIAMSPIGDRHLECVDRLNMLLANGLKDRAMVRVQGSIRLDDRSEPEPDFALLKPRDRAHASGPRMPPEVFWLIEVMDTSAAYDRGTKVGIYARAGIAELWLVDLNQERVEVYSQPARGLYRKMLIYTRGESFSSDPFPDLVLDVDAILG